MSGIGHPTGLSPAPLPPVARDGQLLVMHREAKLPNLCVTTGGAAEGMPDEVTVAHQEGANVGVMFGAMGAILGVLIARWMGNKFQIAVPQSESARSTRWWMGTIGIALLVAGIAGFIPAITFLAPGSDVRLYAAGGSFLAALIGVAMWLDNLQPVRIAKVDGDYLWLAGAGEEYLKTLPEWPKKDPTQAAV